jgi:peptidylamidoglycolate lyase
MKKISAAVAVFAVLLGIAGFAQNRQDKGGGDVTGPYEVVPGWPQNWCGPGFVIGSTAGIWAESPDRVIIFSRGCLPELKQPGDLVPTRNASGFDLSQKDPANHPRWDHIVNIVDRNGRLVESWEQHNKLFVRPHRVLVSPHDPERHVWLVDDGAHAIFKFTRDGKQLVQTIGTPRMPGNDQTHFARPTDIAFLADGTFFVSDGYVNTRVVKFDRTGKYLTSWGMAGTPPNETRPYYMNTVHAIVIDKKNRLYVSDRANHRVQIFDENGKFLEAWPNVPLPYSFLMSDDQHLWSASGQTQKFTKYDLNGRLLAAWGTFGAMPGGFWGVHQFHVDSENNLYTADVHVGRPQKFRPKPNLSAAERVRLIGPPTRNVKTSSSNN